MTKAGRNQNLAGMPHPSVTNAEIIAFFLDEKSENHSL